jgi:hypothetical protein
MQTHNFTVRQQKLQLSPDHATLTGNVGQLVKGEQIFVFIAADFNASGQQANPIVGMLGKPFAHGCCFKFHADTNDRYKE